MAEDKTQNGSYDVGYGKPPSAHQFKPGQSGNRQGRPKGPGNVLKVVAKHAKTKVTVIENGTEKKMAKIDVVISAMFNKASKGDVSAARLLTNLIMAASQLADDTFQSAYSQADLDVMLEEADYHGMLAGLREEAHDEAEA